MGFEVMFVVVVWVEVLEEMDWTWEMGVVEVGVEMGVTEAGVFGAMGWAGESGVVKVGVVEVGVAEVGVLGVVGAEVWVGGFAGFIGEGDEDELV